MYTVVVHACSRLPCQDLNQIEYLIKIKPIFLVYFNKVLGWTDSNAIHNFSKM